MPTRVCILSKMPGTWSHHLSEEVLHSVKVSSLPCLNSNLNRESEYKWALAQNTPLLKPILCFLRTYVSRSCDKFCNKNVLAIWLFDWKTLFPNSISINNPCSSLYICFPGPAFRSFYRDIQSVLMSEVLAHKLGITQLTVKLSNSTFALIWKFDNIITNLTLHRWETKTKTHFKIKVLIKTKCIWKALCLVAVYLN